MRVAIFTDNDFDKINGVTTTLKAVLRHAPADLQPRVYTLSDLGTCERDYVALASRGVGLPYYPGMRIYFPRLAALLRTVREDQVQVLHLTTPGPVGLAARWVARRLGLPIVGSFHTHLAEYATTLSGSHLLGTGMNAYMRWLYGTCDPVLVPSAATRTMLERSGWRRERLSLWSRGVDTALFTPARRSAALRESWRVSDRRPAVIYAGRLSREKGLDLIPAIESRLHRLRASHRLIFVGDGPYRATLQAACPDAVFTGALSPEDVATAMASSDVFLFPSTTDSLGNVVLEAQASRLPVIVSDGGGPRENLQDGLTGHVCAGGDAGDFARRVAGLLGGHDGRIEMAVRARAYAEQRTWARALRPLYQSWRASALARTLSRARALTFAGGRP